VEAWIETPLTKLSINLHLVASRVEAWIETSLSKPNQLSQRSPPAWRRGLKPACPICNGVGFVVASRVEAWIETGIK